MNGAITTPFDARATADDVLRDVDLHGRNFIVTGGASGIGRETTLALARRGAEVTIGVRDAGPARTWIDSIGPLGDRVDARHVDLADPGSVARFAAGFAGPLHGLVANAGVMALPERTVNALGWEMQLAVNYLGHFQLARSLHDAMAQAQGARVVTVSSAAHMRAGLDFADLQFVRRPYDRWAAYAQSKAADVLLAVGIDDRWSDDGIRANSLMPGWILTNLQRHLDDDTLRSMGAMDDEGNRIEQSFFKSPQQGAATSSLLVASALVEGVGGRYFEDNQESDVVDGAGHTTGVASFAVDRDNAARLWAIGEAALG